MKTQTAVRAALAIALGLLIGVSFPANSVTNFTVIDSSIINYATADEIAKELLDDRSYKCLKQIIYKESRGNSKAKNPDSSAKGLGQLINASYKNLGMEHSESEGAQLVAMLGYIGRKYGSAGPCGALKYHLKHNHY